jgi:hypothetical protein
MWLSELKSGVNVEQIGERRKRNSCLTCKGEYVKTSPVLRVSFHPEAVALAFECRASSETHGLKNKQGKRSTCRHQRFVVLYKKMDRMFQRQAGWFRSAPSKVGGAFA